MAHGSVSDVLEEHVISVLVYCAYGGAGQALGWCMASVGWSWCAWRFLRRVLLWLLLFLLAKVGGCLVDAIYEQGYCGEIFDCGNVRVDKHVGVNACEVIGVQPEDPAHGVFDHRTAAVMFDAVLGCMAASEKTHVVACVSFLKSCCGVPLIPYCAEDSCPDPWCSGLLQLCE